MKIDVSILLNLSLYYHRLHDCGDKSRKEEVSDMFREMIVDSHNFIPVWSRVNDSKRYF